MSIEAGAASVERLLATMREVDRVLGREPHRAPHCARFCGYCFDEAVGERRAGNRCGCPKCHKS